MTDIFQYQNQTLGKLSIRPMNPEIDSHLVHQWVTADHASFWCMSDMTQSEVLNFYTNMINETSSKPYIGYVNETPLFLLEVYLPKDDEVGQHYPVEEGDMGMHFLIAPKGEKPIHGLSLGILRSIMQFIFSKDHVNRVVVEPDINNTKIHPLNEKVGFQYQQPISLSYKTARLAFCTKEHFFNTLKSEN